MRKLPLFVSCILTAVLASTPVFAQSEAKVPAAAVAEKSPGKCVADFFQKLVEGRVDAAYDELLKGTKIAEMPKDVAILKAKTKEAIRAFGDLGGYELVEEKKVGDNGLHLRRLTCISLGSQFPIRWRFYFYNKGQALAGSWKLIDIRIDDRLPDLFEEPAPTVATPAK